MEYLHPQFFLSSDDTPIIDVRSPGEFAKGHIKNAINIALFDDQERHEVGTIYVNKGKNNAISQGLKFVGPKMQKLVNKALDLTASTQNRKIYCWRGGMRSEKMAWLFELAGLKCSVLKGGYKAYRNQQISDFLNIKYPVVLHGSTGCGKTEILHRLTELGEQIIDLEAFANHRGSAFGHLGQTEQPTSQQFQNNVHNALIHMDPEKRIWFEAESLKIGLVNMPDALWERMKKAPTVEIKIHREERIKRLVSEYGSFSEKELSDGILNISERLGGQRVNSALDALKKGNLAETADILLDYYDRAYDFSRRKFRERITYSITSGSGDAMTNAKMLINRIKGMQEIYNES